MGAVNINKAKLQELQCLKGIGPVRAQEITGNRPYRDVYELSKVAGLGKKRMDAIIKQGITV